MTDENEEVEIDDEALELAAGSSITLVTNPAQMYPNSTSVTNSTIYFQAN